MVRHEFRVLRNAVALRAVPLALWAEFLEPWSGWAATRGLAPDGGSFPHAFAAALATPDAAMPRSLAEALDRIEDLADERGFDLLMARAPGAAAWADLSPLHIAVQAWVGQRVLFEEAWTRRTASEVRGLREYPGKTGDATARPVAAERLQVELGAFFAAQGRTRFCRVEGHADAGRRCWLIRHGRAVRVDRQVEEVEVDGTLTWRPQEQDLVAFDERTGRLLIRAGAPRTFATYRRAFGSALFGDPEHFVEEPVVDLAPIAERGVEALKPTVGVRDVALAEVRLEVPRTCPATVCVSGEGVTAWLREGSLPGLAHGGRPVYARLLMRYGRGVPRAVELRVPNLLAFDRRVHEAETIRFLEERGFLVPGTGATPTDRRSPLSRRGQLRLGL